MTQSYKDLIVWQKSMRLVKLVYDLTATFPPKEMYALTQQMCKSAVSIPSNIAEGSRRGSKKDYRRCLLIAYGSGAELETQLEIAEIIGYSANVQKRQESNALLSEVMKMLNSLISSLGARKKTTNYSLQPTH